VEDTTKKMKKQVTDWEKLLQSIFEFYPEYIKNFQNSENKPPPKKTINLKIPYQRLTDGS